MVIKTLPFNAGDAGTIPGWGRKVQHAPLPKKTKTENRNDNVTNSIKT